MKTGALLEAMRRLGYDAVNVGERDMRSGYAEFVQRTEASKLRFISANLVRQDDQRPVFPPHAVVDLDDGRGGKRRVGVIGVLRYNPLFLKAGPGESNMIIDPPDKRVEKEVAALRAKDVDTIVLLAAMHQTDAQRLATEIPGIDYILGSYGGVFHNAPLRNGDTELFYCGNKGQRVGELRLFFGEGDTGTTHEARMHFLNASYPADEAMLEFVNSVPAKPDSHESSWRRPAGGAASDSPADRQATVNPAAR